MKLSIIVPVYNEEKTVKHVLDKLISIKLPCEKEIIVVDDGSTDATNERIRNYEVGFRNKNNLKIIYHVVNKGKGAAVRSGIKAATGDHILIQDADLEYNPEEIPKLLFPVLNQRPKTDNQPPIAVYGSRFLNNQATIPLLYLLGNKFLTFLTNILYGTKLTDMETCYKLLPASFLKNTKLNSNHFDIEPEITVKLVKAKIPIKEVAISYHGRSHPAGKKLTVRDAWGAIQTLAKSKFN